MTLRDRTVEMSSEQLEMGDWCQRRQDTAVTRRFTIPLRAGWSQVHYCCPHLMVEQEGGGEAEGSLGSVMETTRRWVKRPGEPTPSCCKLQIDADILKHRKLCSCNILRQIAPFEIQGCLANFCAWQVIV